MKKRAVVGLQLPTKDFERVTNFYAELLGWSFSPNPEIPAIQMAETGNLPVLFSPVHGEHRAGEVIFAVEIDDIDAALVEVERLGGKTLIPKTKNSMNTYFAMFYDPAGAKVALIETSTDVRGDLD